MKNTIFHLKINPFTPDSAKPSPKLLKFLILQQKTLKTNSTTVKYCSVHRIKTENFAPPKV